MASKRKYSPLWNHFEETEPKRARCQHCSKVLAMSSNSIGSLSRHMKKVHPTVNIVIDRMEPITETTEDPVPSVYIDMQQPSTSTEITMASKRKYSPLWNHFEETEPKRARCQHCSKVLAMSSNSIGSLGRHMKKVHPTVNIVIDRMESITETTEDPVPSVYIDMQQPSTFTERTSAATSTATVATIPRTTARRSARVGNFTSIADYITIKKPVPVNKMQQLDEQLLVMIAKGYHAFRLVEEPEFRKLVAMLNPNYSLPTRETLSVSLLSKTYEKVLQNVQNSIKNAISSDSAICITTDGWTSITNDPYIAITAHYIDKNNHALCSVMIGCIHFEQRHTSDNLVEFLRHKFAEWNITNQINAVVTDNAANILGAVRLGGWRSISCLAHSINLVVQDSINKNPEISGLVAKVKQIVEYFHRSGPGAKKLKEIQEQMSMPSLKLKQDVSTRWTSTFDMLERVAKIKEPIIATIAIMRTDLSLPQESWEIIEKTLPVLKIFNEVTKEISEEQYVTASKYIVLCKLMTKQLQKFAGESSAPIARLVHQLNTELKHRFGEVEKKVILAEATILDPRFKKSGFQDPRNYEAAAATLRQVFLHDENEAVGETSIASTLGPSGLSSIWEAFDVEISQVVPENPVAAGIVEFDKYIQEPLLHRLQDPLQWWKERRAVYPRLYSYMLNRLNVTATSVPCERVFSKAGLTLNDRRIRLTTKKLEQLMFISANHSSEKKISRLYKKNTKKNKKKN